MILTITTTFIKLAKSPIKMIISLIAAMSKNRVIGNKGKLPWHMPSDLKYYKDKIRGKTVIMGRKTFDSMGKKPLPKRINIIITHDMDYKAEGAIVVHSAEEAIKEAEKLNTEEAMVIGGSEIYKEFLPMANRIYLTMIYGDFEGDAFFPRYGKEWKEASREKHNADAENPYSYEFIVLEK